MTIRLLILFLLLVISPVAFSQNKTGNKKTDLKRLITDLHKHQWEGAINMMSPTHWTFRFTRPMEEILKAGNSAQKQLLTHLKEESIKEQIIILLGGVGDEKSVEPIINAMISETDIKAVPNAEQINNTANLALTNITVADVIWHHGGGIVIERCPDNPKECWSDWWSRNKTTFSVKGIKQSRRYSNYPNYGIYKNK